MKVELNESLYARFKVLDMTDVDICFLLGISPNKLSSFKFGMDYFEFDCKVEDYKEQKEVKKFQKRMKRIYDPSGYRIEKNIKNNLRRNAK